MRFTSSVAAACTVAFAHAATIQNEKRATGLEVTLAPAEGSAADVIATIKNVGAESINLMTLGTFLDSAPVQKFGVVDEASMFPLSYSQYCVSELCLISAHLLAI